MPRTMSLAQKRFKVPFSNKCKTDENFNLANQYQLQSTLVVLWIMGIVAVLTDWHKWVVYIVHACVSFANYVFQKKTFILCSFPSSLCIVPASSVHWTSHFFITDHFLLIPNHHWRMSRREIDSKLVLHHLNNQYSTNNRLSSCLLALIC